MTVPDPIDSSIEIPDADSAAARIAKRLRRSGLAGIAGALIEAGAPLAPLIGQLLYVAQPTLGLFMPRRSIGNWAEWLDQPTNLADFVQKLNDQESSDRRG